MRPFGFAALTVSIVEVPRVESVNGMPAAAAADAPAVSPSVCMRRVNPVGAMPKGIADVPPRIVVVVSSRETSRRIEGWNSMSSNAWRARVSDSSPSAEPSV